MGILPNIFGRKGKGTVKNAGESANADRFHSFAQIDSALSEFSDGYKLVAPVLACADRITSRALRSNFTYDGKAIDMASPSRLPGQGGRDFWKEAFHNYLLTGNCLLVPAGSGMDMARPSSIALRWEGSSVIYDYTSHGAPTGNARESARATANAAMCALVRWRPNSFGELSGGPLASLVDERKAYASSLKLAIEYLLKANRVTGVVTPEGEHADVNKVQGQLDTMTKALSTQGAQFRYMNSPPGVKVSGMASPATPPARELAEGAVADIARLYGVPLQLLQLSGERMDIEQLEANLLRDAVLPLLDAFASALTKALGKEVTYDAAKLALPSASGMAVNASKLAQAGILTIDELREMVGKPPLPKGQGNRLPETAGAAERTNKENGNENQG